MSSYSLLYYLISFFFFFFNDTATTEIYTLSLHDALPICAARAPQRAPRGGGARRAPRPRGPGRARGPSAPRRGDRKSTRLNSSHTVISYAVFCLKKKKYNREQLIEKIDELTRYYEQNVDD